VTLLVDAPAAYEPERRYSVDVVLADRLGLDWRLRIQERADVRIMLEGDPDGRYVLMPDVLFATPASQWLTPSSLPRGPVTWSTVVSAESAALRPGERVPILYGSPVSGDPVASRAADSVTLTVDVLGSCFFMLSRYEELVVAARDAYGRFPASASLAHREAFLHLPVADTYVEILWSAIVQLWPRLERKARSFRLALSHDVDDPLASAGRTPYELVRQLGADALRRRDAALASRRLRSWAARRRGDYRLDPYNTFDFLMDVSERHGISSAFYFLATERGMAPDHRYTLAEPWIESLLRRIHQRDHEIGFHASFESYRDPQRTADEFYRLCQAAKRQGVSQDRWGGRQHFLRWENPVTWSNWEQAGLEYDSTLAFPERVGFRAGTCHEFPAFDLRQRRPLGLRERPLHVMDATLFEYMKLAPDAALETVVATAGECRRHGGTLLLLWHNSSIPTARQKRWYEALVSTVSGR
jgi:hypothetical protein